MLSFSRYLFGRKKVEYFTVKHEQPDYCSDGKPFKSKKRFRKYFQFFCNEYQILRDFISLNQILEATHTPFSKDRIEI